MGIINDRQVADFSNKLRARVNECGKKPMYYLAEDEYRLGIHLRVLELISTKPQGHGVVSVKTRFEGNIFVCSLVEEEH